MYLCVCLACVCVCMYTLALSIFIIGLFTFTSVKIMSSGRKIFNFSIVNCQHLSSKVSIKDKIKKI